ncbi:MAG: MBL fold metallo-hydrolase [Bdellovibrionales bacterium]|nr:MBL fold metallo-hydrolase [Bdellovibrionales bacterium]
MTLRLTFHGAAGTVTGSKYLVETDSQKILVDCGLFQGKKELRLRNWGTPPFDPTSLDAILLTHAHIDHTGYLPLIVRRGFQGPIFCTAATAELLGLLLPDSGHLQEEEARHANRHGTSKHHPAKPLYTEADARAVLPQLRVLSRHQRTEVLPGVFVEAHCAGHILGSVILTVETGGKRITFSGDIGRYHTPLLPDPEGVALGDLLLCESTYGDRDHPTADVRQELGDAVRAAVERKGPIIIPAFAVGRTQNLLYYLAELERSGQIPVLPVYVDSPMAVDASMIYRRHHNDYDEEATQLQQSGVPAFLTERTIFCREREESKRLNHLSGARVIISASGMVTGGRVLHHLRHNLPNEKTTVLFVGFQAEGTRGRTIQSGAPTVRIFGQDVPIRAAVHSITSLSAHGDRNELLRWLRSCEGSPRTMRIVHGEPAAASAFSELVSTELGWQNRPAEHGEVVELG